jgi:hypothetical protein
MTDSAAHILARIGFSTARGALLLEPRKASSLVKIILRVWKITTGQLYMGVKEFCPVRKLVIQNCMALPLIENAAFQFTILAMAISCFPVMISSLKQVMKTFC